MYNRYLRNDDGVYTRMPMQDAPRGEPPRGAGGLGLRG